MAKPERLERKADRLAAAANRAANAGNTQRELRLHDRWEKADAKAQKAAK